jgi:mRNA-degrading endonuclease RelE of RelBE toxin-antitoxin system
MRTVPIAVCETDEFLSGAEAVWSEEERQRFIDFIALNPQAGDLVQGAGGVRKVRWSRAGSGKSGGVRVIYYFYNEMVPIYLISFFAKSQKSDLSSADKKALAEFARTVKTRIKSAHQAQVGKN